MLMLYIKKIKLTNTMFWNIYSIINNLIFEKNIRNANRPKSIRVCQKGNSHSFHYQIKLL